MPSNSLVNVFQLVIACHQCYLSSMLSIFAACLYLVDRKRRLAIQNRTKDIHPPQASLSAFPPSNGLLIWRVYTVVEITPKVIIWGFGSAQVDFPYIPKANVGAP